MNVELDVEYIVVEHVGGHVPGQMITNINCRLLHVQEMHVNMDVLQVVLMDVRIIVEKVVEITVIPGV